MSEIRKDKLHRFTAKAIEPRGWIKHQLETQLNGLSGHLVDFWKDIKDAAWIGGSSDSWERVPYWLDGYIPLVYLLNDKKGIKTAKFYVDNILNRQQEDGWIAPGKVEEREKYDVWGIFIVLKALTEYATITKRKDVYAAIYKALKALDKHIDKYPLFMWAYHRWYECLIPIYAIYPLYKEQWLLDLAKKLHDQGFDFEKYYKNEIPHKKSPKGEWGLLTHTVNNTMAVKGYALYAKMSKSAKEAALSKWMLRILNKYHGTVNGTISGDECLAGRDPQQGTELCAIVELMYSLETLTSITGKTDYLAQLERLAFNALPSSLTNDMWAHQYDNQVNAPFIKRSEKNLWTTNGPESNIYGLEPHFGCCTSNFHQGFPKFVTSSVYYSSKGLFFASYIPLSIKTNKFEIEVIGGYPFDTNVGVVIKAKKACKVNFFVPSWSEDFIVNDEKAKANKGWAMFELKEGENRFNIEIKHSPKFEQRYQNKFAIVDGPLVYALKVDSEKVQINMDNPERAYPHADYEFHEKSDFAFRFASKNIKVVPQDYSYMESPFVTERPATLIFANVEPVDYRIVGNYIKMNENKITGKAVNKEFAPIGIFKCHMGELALKKEDK